MTSQERIEKYKKKGAKIGKNVKIGEGTEINFKKLEIGDNTEVGNNCYIDCESLKLGKLNKIGNNAQITCKDVEIGDVLFTSDNIVIGGAEAKGPYSKFKMGRLGFIGWDALINTTKEVNIGNNVCIGPRAMIYTHGHWQSVLEGYYAARSNVTINNDVWIGTNVVVLPGVNIGKGSTVTVNSVVLSRIPDNCLVTGNPGRIIKRPYPTPPTTRQKERIMDTIMEELVVQFKYKGFPSEKNNNTIKTKFLDYNVFIEYDIKRIIIKFKNFDVVFDLNKKVINGKQNNLTDEIRELLRKYGIKFEPYLWRYLPP